jgi:hypothetical protein
MISNMTLLVSTYSQTTITNIENTWWRSPYRLVFIKNKVDRGEIRVINCPAEEMWADVLTKPLQGMAFKTMRAQLMNFAINYKDEEEKTQSKLMPVHSRRSVTWKDTKPQSLQSPQECVGLNRQKHLPRPTTDRRLRIARIQNRTRGAKNKVNSEQ